MNIGGSFIESTFPDTKSVTVFLVTDDFAVKMKFYGTVAVCRLN